MNIAARIVARKIVLTYFYEKMIADYIVQNDHMLEEINNISLPLSVLSQKEEDSTPQMKADLTAQFSNSDFDEDITYIVKNGFEKHLESGIDFEYINTVGKTYKQYKDEIATGVNKFATSFKYEDMDLIDRVIFLLGYAEYRSLKTPKEIVMNEMVELAKKYGDEGTPKLVNGILHKIIADLDAEEKGDDKKGEQPEEKSAKKPRKKKDDEKKE